MKQFIVKRLDQDLLPVQIGSVAPIFLTVVELHTAAHDMFFSYYSSFPSAHRRMSEEAN
jgi:hypothetical protein